MPCQQEQFPGSILLDDEYDNHSIDMEHKLKLTSSIIVDESFVSIVYGSNKELPLLLVVEDNNDLSLYISKIFSEEYRVIVATNGKEGCDYAKKFSPDLILSDVMMPVMDGIEMCTQLKESLYTSHIPFIMLSARSMPENFVEGISVGADDYLSKPFNVHVLKAKVKSLIDSRRRLKKLYSTVGIDESHIESNSFSGIDDQFIRKAYEVVERNYNNPDFSVEVFSEAMCVSRSLLYKKLKALADLSPNDFITIHRLKKSITLLSDGNMSINEIAYQIGFNDPKYFSRVFKKFYQKTPSDYLN